MNTTNPSAKAPRRPQSREEAEAALQASAQKIEADLEQLQQEVRQLGHSVREAIWRHPLVSIGGSLVAGLVVGWLLGGLGRSRRPRLSRAHQMLVSSYLEALMAEVRKAKRRGGDPEEAMRRALEKRLPVIVVQDGEASEKGILRSIGGAVLGVVGSAVSVAVSRALADRLLDAFAASEGAEAVEEITSAA